MDRTDALALLHQMLDVVEDVDRGPRPPADPEILRGTLPLDLPVTGRPLPEVRRRLEALLRVTPQSADGRSYSQLTSGRDWPAVVGDMLVPVLDHTLATWRSSGSQVWVEDVVVRRMLALLGMPDGEGTFAPGGSLSNLAALVLARDAAEETASREGIGRPHTVYTSASAHYSVRKAAAIAGLGRGRVRAIATDGSGRMDPAALAEQLRADTAAGLRPTAIVATSGTSVEGAFDPLVPLADLAATHGAWLHVDGAWGGAAALVPELRTTKLAGIERADSVTWDAHKAMGVPLTSSLLAVREPGHLAASLDETATYLFGGSAGDNPGRRSLLCGRRNDVLKLWLAWQVHGDAGYEARIRGLLRQTALAVGRVRDADHLTLLLEPEWLNVCFTVDGHEPRAVCARLEADHVGVIGFATVHGSPCIRLVLADANRTDAQVHAVFDAIEAMVG